MTNLRLCYQTIEFGKTDIHLCTLRSKQEFYDPNGTAERLGISSAVWPLFGIVWPSSIVLAHHIQSYDTDNKRVLEIGCGIGLTSLLLNKKDVDITATDYHPEAATFLARNSKLNGDSSIPFVRTGWADKSDSLGMFDLIVGSDLLYEDEHVELLSNFIITHSNDKCEVIIVDPGRGRNNKLAKALAKFGYSYTSSKPSNTDYLANEFKGRILRFYRSS